MDDALLPWATNLPPQLLRPPVGSALASRLSGCLPSAALAAIRQRVAAWQLQQPHGAAAAPPAWPQPRAPERGGSSSSPAIPTAALLRALGGAAAAAQHDPKLQPPTPVVHSSACHGPSGAAVCSRPDSRQPTSSSSLPGLAAMPAVRGRRADHPATASKPEQPAAAATKAGSKQQGGKWGSQAGGGGSTSAAGAAALHQSHSRRSRRSRAQGSTLALAAGCLPLSALLLLLLARGLTEAPAVWLDMLFSSARAWWLASSWAATAALLCTHAAYVRAGWRWAVALDAGYLLMLAACAPAPFSLLAAMGALLVCRLLLLVAACTKNSATARDQHASKEHAPCSRLSSRMHLARWQKQPGSMA